MYYYLLKFCHCVSLLRDFASLSHFVCKKLWFCAVENLGSSHRVSVVRGKSVHSALYENRIKSTFFWSVNHDSFKEFFAENSCAVVSLVMEFLQRRVKISWIFWSEIQIPIENY